MVEYQIRFQCDAGNNLDDVFIDEVKIEGGGSPPSGSWVTYDDDDVSWTYTGSRELCDWEYYYGGYSMELYLNAYGEFTFTGTKCELYVYKNPNFYGTASMYIDDDLKASGLDVSADPEEFQTLMWASGTLSNEEHVFKGLSTGGGDALSIDFIRVWVPD